MSGVKQWPTTVPAVWPRPTAAPSVFLDFLDSLLQLVLRDRLLGHSGELEDVIDDLVLEERRLDLLAHLGVLLDELEELPLLAGKLAGAVHDRLGHLGVGHLDLVLPTEFCKQN